MKPFKSLFSLFAVLIIATLSFAMSPVSAAPLAYNFVDTAGAIVNITETTTITSRTTQSGRQLLTFNNSNGGAQDADNAGGMLLAKLLASTAFNENFLWVSDRYVNMNRIISAECSAGKTVIRFITSATFNPNDSCVGFNAIFAVSN